MNDKPKRTPLPEVRWRPWTKKDEDAEMQKPDPLVQMALKANSFTSGCCSACYRKSRGEKRIKMVDKQCPECGGGDSLT